jgi:hypothetical protein
MFGSSPLSSSAHRAATGIERVLKYDDLSDMKLAASAYLNDIQTAIEMNVASRPLNDWAFPSAAWDLPPAPDKGPSPEQPPGPELGPSEESPPEQESAEPKFYAWPGRYREMAGAEVHLARRVLRSPSSDPEVS